MNSQNFDIDDGPWNNVYLCGKKHEIQLKHFPLPRLTPGRPGLTSGYPNCTFTITVPANCPGGVDWNFLGKKAHGDRDSPSCPHPDKDAPTFTQCPGTLSVHADQGSDKALLSLTATATDKHGKPTVSETFDGSSGTGSYTLKASFPIGTTTFNFVATDNSGNTAICATSVTVVDTQPPVLTVHLAQYATVTDPGKAYAAIGATIVKVSASDNDRRAITVTNNYALGAAGVDANGNYYLGSTVVVFSAHDYSGNPAVPVNCTVTITDNQPPTISVPATASGTLPACGSPCTATLASVTVTALDISDNSGLPASVSVAVGSLTATPVAVAGPPYAFTGSFGYGPTTIYWLAEDGAHPSNKATPVPTVVTVADNSPPVVTCPAPVTGKSADTGASTWTGTVTATAADNSGSFTWLPNLGSPHTQAFQQGTTQVTFTATDAAGNTASCTTSVQVIDTQQPTLLCPQDITVDSTSGGATGVVTGFVAHATDNVAVTSISTPCGGKTTLNADGSADLDASSGFGTCAYEIGTTAVTFTASDGTTAPVTCTAHVTVVDVDPPTFITPNFCNQLLAPVIVGSSTYYAPNTLSVAATDATSVSYSWTAQWPSNLGLPAGSATSGTGSTVTQNWARGTTQVTFYAEDEFHNIAACLQTVVVNDATPPSLGCRGDPIQLTCPAGASTMQYTDSVTSDNVALLALSYSLVGGTTTDGLTTASVDCTLAPCRLSPTITLACGGASRQITWSGQDVDHNFAHCTETMSAVVPDACSAGPCGNGGTCASSSTAPGYTCTCPAGFTGDPTCTTISPTCSMYGDSQTSDCPLHATVKVNIGSCQPNVYIPNHFAWSATGPDSAALNQWLQGQNTANLVVSGDLLAVGHLLLQRHGP